MSKPSILLITGACMLPEFYDEVVDAVAAKGYEINALHHRSAGLKTGPREGEPPTMYNDAAFIAQQTRILADEGKDVVLLAHSYGGVPATESVKGLGKEERQKQGKKGGVVRLAYMTALVPPLGVAAGSVLASAPGGSDLEMKDDGTGWLYHPNPAASAAIVYSHLPKEEGVAWIKRYPKHTAVCYAGELTHAGYRDVPVSYLFCEEDLVIPPKVQRDGIELIERESGRKVDVTSIKADHCPMTTQPQTVIDWMLHVAERKE